MFPVLLLLLFTPLAATPLYWALFMAAAIHWAWSAGAEAASAEYHRGRRILATGEQAAAHRGLRSWLWWIWQAIRHAGALRRGLRGPEGGDDVIAIEGPLRQPGPLRRILAAIWDAVEAYANEDADRRMEGETIHDATWADWRGIFTDLRAGWKRWRAGQGWTPPGAVARWQAPPPMRQCQACGLVHHRDALTPREVTVNGIRRHLLMCEDCWRLNAPAAPPAPAALDPDRSWPVIFVDETGPRMIGAPAPAAGKSGGAAALLAEETPGPAPAGTGEPELVPAGRPAIEGGNVVLPASSPWVPGAEVAIRARTVPAGRLAGPVLGGPVVGQSTDVHHGGWLAMTAELLRLNEEAHRQYEGCVAELRLLNPQSPQFRECMAWLEKVQGLHLRIAQMITRVDAKEGPVTAATEALGGPGKRNPSSYHAESN